MQNQDLRREEIIISGAIFEIVIFMFEKLHFRWVRRGGGATPHLQFLIYAEKIEFLKILIESAKRSC